MIERPDPVHDAADGARICRESSGFLPTIWPPTTCQVAAGGKGVLLHVTLAAGKDLKVGQAEFCVAHVVTTLAGAE